jgi:hypothetical protein
MDLMRFPVSPIVASALLGLLVSASLHAQTVSTVAGSGAAGLVDGPAPLAQFNRPTWLDVDARTGAIYVVDRANHFLRRIVNGAVTTPDVGTPWWVTPAVSIHFDFGGPYGGGIAIEPPSAGCGGNAYGPGIFVSSSAEHQLVLLAENGFKITHADRDDVIPVIGAGVPGMLDGNHATARFNHPGDVALSWNYGGGVGTYKTDAVYVADTANHAIRRIRFGLSFEGCQQPRVVETVASGFNAPRGVAAAPDGSIYVADTGNHAIKRIAPDGTVTTIVAEGLNSPSGIDVNALGEVFIADTGNYVIRKLTTDGRLITIAGTPGVAGYADGPARSARFSGPIGIRLFGSSLYIADTANNVIRKLDMARRRAASH